MSGFYGLYWLAGSAFIGLIGSTVTPLIATQKKLPVTQGALVEDVITGAGAATAGV